MRKSRIILPHTAVKPMPFTSTFESANGCRGISRDQMMSKHTSNHVQVVYATGEGQAHKARCTKAAVLSELGLHVNFCGDVPLP